MQILDINKAKEIDYVSEGSVMINTMPQVRSGKKNDFMVGEFVTAEGRAEFKIWEARTFETVLEHGVGIYDVEVCGSEFNGLYLTVRRIQPSTDASLSRHDFLPQLSRDRLTALWNDVVKELTAAGVSYSCWKLAEKLIYAPELNGRFALEGAAVRHHDNKIGGLIHHSSKMLGILAALLKQMPELRDSADLLTLGVLMHDIGKVYEYQDLAPATYWYSNHRVRGIEFLAAHKDEIVEAYDETFYRHLQSIISGHHGDYGDRPTTVAAAIVHYIDTLDSQVTGLLESSEESKGEKIRYGEWGYLQPLPRKSKTNELD